MSKNINLVHVTDLTEGQTILHSENSIVTVTGPGVPTKSYLGEDGFSIPIILKSNHRPDKTLNVFVRYDMVRVLDHRPQGW